MAWCNPSCHWRPGHHTAGELVDDDDLTVDADVIAVFEIRDLAAKRSLDIFIEPVDREADERRIGRDRLNLAAAGSRSARPCARAGSYL